METAAAASLRPTSVYGRHGLSGFLCKVHGAHQGGPHGGRRAVHIEWRVDVRRCTSVQPLLLLRRQDTEPSSTLP